MKKYYRSFWGWSEFSRAWESHRTEQNECVFIGQSAPQHFVFTHIWFLRSFPLRFFARWRKLTACCHRQNLQPLNSGAEDRLLSLIVEQRQGSKIKARKTGKVQFLFENNFRLDPASKDETLGRYFKKSCHKPSHLWYLEPINWLCGTFPLAFAIKRHTLFAR